MANESKQRFEEIKSRMQQARKEMEEQAKTVFHEEMQVIFATYPELMDVSWTQYTPYFADGDVCEFSCHATHSVHINCFGPNPEEPTIETDDEYKNKWPKYSGSASKWETKAANEIVALINALGDDMMQFIFGDHVKVIVGRDKVVVEDYEHE
jgi:hypothetical protein